MTSSWKLLLGNLIFACIVKTWNLSLKPLLHWWRIAQYCIITNQYMANYNCAVVQITWVGQDFQHHILKHKSCHDAYFVIIDHDVNFVITDGTGGCLYDKAGIITTWVGQDFQHHTLKHKSCHDANFVITDGTGGCLYDKAGIITTLSFHCGGQHEHSTRYSFSDNSGNGIAKGLTNRLAIRGVLGWRPAMSPGPMAEYSNWAPHCTRSSDKGPIGHFICKYGHIRLDLASQPWDTQVGRRRGWGGIGNVILVAITGTTSLVPYLKVKSLQLIWRSGTRRWHLRVPDLQMSCSDLTTWQGTRIVVYMASQILIAIASGNGLLSSGTNLLSEPILTVCQFQLNFFKVIHFNPMKCIWKCCLQIGSHFVQTVHHPRWKDIHSLCNPLTSTTNSFLRCES